MCGEFTLCADSQICVHIALCCKPLFVQQRNGKPVLVFMGSLQDPSNRKEQACLNKPERTCHKMVKRVFKFTSSSCKLKLQELQSSVRAGYVEGPSNCLSEAGSSDEMVTLSTLSGLLPAQEAKACASPAHPLCSL